MAYTDLIGNVVKLKRFAPVVDLQWAETLSSAGDLSLIDSYIVTNELAGHFENILESFTLKRNERKALREGNILDASIHPRAHILRGQYGTGKSYFLLMVSALIEALDNEKLYSELYNKFQVFDGIRYHMDILQKSAAKYIVVRLDGVKNADMYFNEFVQKRVVSRIKEVLGECDFYDSYGIAVRKLEEYKNDLIFSKLLMDALDKRSISFDSLIDGLRASKRQSIKKYKEIIQSITRHKIDEGFDSLEEFLRAASSFVKNKGYSGIVIIFDEFSAYIGASIEDGRITSDLAAIQSLAQLTLPREGQDLYFVCSMHADLGRVLGNVMATAEEIQKVRGRFSEMTLSFNNSANLVENILIVDKEKFSDIKRKYKEYFGALPSRYPDMDKVYPIHPHTVSSIISVSSKFAQNERTIFSFFAETVNKKLGEPVIKDERLNLITTGDIYNYFIDTISEKNTILKDSAMRCMSFSRNELEKEIVKALVIAHISAGENFDSRLSSKDIAFIIGVDDIRQIDIFLKELSANPMSNIVFYEKEYRFEFIAAGNQAEDLSIKLDKDAAEIIPYESLLNLLEEYNKIVCMRKTYTINSSKEVFPVRKDLSGVIFRPADLVRAIEYEISDIDKDGKIIFVVPDFNDRIEDNYIQTLMVLLENGPANICIAVPKSFPTQLEQDIRLYTAAINMQKSGTLDENGRKTLQKIIQSIEKIVEYEIKKFGNIENFSFIFNSNIVKSFKSLEELYSFLLKRHYNKFPQIDADGIRGKNSIHTLVEQFFIFGEKTNIPTNYSSELDKLIMDVLRSLDMVKVERSGSGYSARIKIPESANNLESFEVWGIVNDTSRDVKGVFELLEAAPYGLPDYMTELYIAASVATNQLAITFRGQVMQLNKMSIALVKSSGYALEKVRTAPLELKIKVKKIWTAFCSIHPHCAGRNFEPGLPQSDDSIQSLIASDMEDVRIILDSMEARLENAGIKNNTLIELLKLLSYIRTVKNSVEYMEEFADLPIKLSGSYNDTAAFECFEGFLGFLTDINTSIDIIRRINVGISDMRNLEAIEDDYEELKSKYYEIVSSFDVFKREIEKDFFSQQNIRNLEANYNILLQKYNGLFVSLHNEVSEKTRKLNLLLEDPSIKVIESFEKISFKNIKKLSDIQGELSGIRICAIHHTNKADEPLSCPCTGYGAGITGLLEQLELLKRMGESMQKQIANIAGNHISRLLSFDQKVEERKSILSDYLKDVSQKESFEVGDKLLKDWNSLKKYLEGGFETIKENNSEEIIQLIENLKHYINDYLIHGASEQKKPEEDSKVKKKIGFRKLYQEVQSEILNSGFKSVSTEEFIAALQRLIEKIRKEYDQIDIEE